MTHRQILFVDIETVLEFEFLKDVPLQGQEAFCKRFQHKVEELLGYKIPDGPDIAEIEEIKGAFQTIYEQEAPFMAEYSKIVCLSAGKFYQKDNSKEENPDTLRVKAFAGNEVEILTEFIKICPFFDFLCAHNGKLFDFPFLVKRVIIHRLSIPTLLFNLYKKPWEVPLIDTAEMWATTNRRQLMSLDTVAYCLGVPSPKDEMDGSMVGQYFREGKIDNIKVYCQGDVLTDARVYMVMIGKSDDFEIEYA
jgi:predicted PolB exonuclease-like 3'-5' exonuclease